MAKLTKTYPTGVVRTVYETKRALPTPIEYRGKVKQTAFNNRVYYKPSLNKVVIRKKGVTRVSEDVRKINEQLEKLTGLKEHPSFQCGGLPWDKRIKCLKAKMREVIKPVAEVLG